MGRRFVTVVLLCLLNFALYLNCSFYNPLACVEEAGSSEGEYTDTKGTVQLSPGVSDNLGMHEGRDQSPLCPDPDGTCWGPFLSVGKSRVSGVAAGVAHVALALGVPTQSPNCCVTLGDSHDCDRPRCEMRMLRPNARTGGNGEGPGWTRTGAGSGR